MNQEVKLKATELIASTERAAFLQDRDRQSEVTQSEMAKFWAAMVPLVQDTNYALKGWYELDLMTAGSIKLRYIGDSRTITALNVKFLNTGKLVLDITHTSEKGEWALRMVDVDSFSWQTQGKEGPIKAVAEDSLLWFLDRSIAQLASNKIIVR